MNNQENNQFKTPEPPKRSRGRPPKTSPSTATSDSDSHSDLDKDQVPIVKEKKSRGRPKSSPSPSQTSSINSNEGDTSFMLENISQELQLDNEPRNLRKTPRRISAANDKSNSTDTERSPIKKKQILQSEIENLSKSLFFTQPTLAQPSSIFQQNQVQTIRKDLKTAARQLDVNLHFDFKNKLTLTNEEPLYVYHQKQHEQNGGAQCGLIALRNGLQIDYGLDIAYMERVGDELSSVETTLNHPGFYTKGVGWYSSHLIGEVLSQLGLVWKFYNSVPVDHPVKANKKAAIFFITLRPTNSNVSNQNHYFVCRRFFDGGKLWNLNSFNQFPQTENESYLDDLVNQGATISLIVIPKNHFLANPNNLKFHHINKSFDQQPNTLPEPIREIRNHDITASQQSDFLEIIESEVLQSDNDDFIPNQTENSWTMNPIGYHPDLINLRHNDLSYIYGTREEICINYNLMVFDVPGDGHCFIHCVQRFFNLVFGVNITLKHLYEEALNIFMSDPDLLNDYRSMKVLDDTISNHTSTEAILLTEMNRYFEYKQWENNIFLDFFINIIRNILSIDILIVQPNRLDENVKSLFLNEPTDRLYNKSTFMLLYKTSAIDHSHYQLLLPSKFSLPLTNSQQLINRQESKQMQSVLDTGFIKQEEESLSETNDSLIEESSTFYSGESNIALKTSFIRKKRKTHFSSGKKNKNDVLKNQKKYEIRLNQTSDEKTLIKIQDTLKHKETYNSNPAPKKAQSKQSYAQNPESKKAQSKNSYAQDPEPKKAQSKQSYAIDPIPKQRQAREQSKQSYAQDPKRNNDRTKQYYQENAETIKQKQKDKYHKRTEAQKERDKQRAKEYRDLQKEQKKNKKVDSSKCPGYFDRDNFDESKYTENYLGPMNSKCRHCGSLNFAGEMVKDKDGGHFSICCHNGKVKLQIPKWPNELKDLYTGKGTPNEPKPVFVEPEENNQKRNMVPFYESSKEFLNNIRTYNNSFSFASTSITIPPQFRNLKPNAATTFVKVQGQIQHRASMLYNNNPDAQKCFGQLYTIDDEEANALRLGFIKHFIPDKKIMKFLSNTMAVYSPFAEAYKHLHEKVQQEAAAANGKIPDIGMYFDRTVQPGQDPNVYNLPTYGGQLHVPEGQGVISCCYVRDNNGLPPKNTFLIYPKHNPSKQQETLYDNNMNCEPMCYPLLFPCGERGFDNYMQHDPNHSTKTHNRLTAKQYAAYRLMVREDEEGTSTENKLCNALFYLTRKLFQLYIVDSYIRAENSDLRYLKKNTKQLKVEKYTNLKNYLENKAAKEDNCVPGKIFVIPSTHTNSPRYMAQNLDDAIAILTDLDEVHPDLMITFTTNPNWREIQENLAPNQTYVDRPDIVARVFNLKLKALMKRLLEDNFFGKTKAHFYVVEFQKRGLPHAHILIILDDENKITDDNVDNFISAEFPDENTNPRLFENFQKFQIHTPCDTDEDAWRFCRFNRDSCEKRFPKDYEEKTFENPETGYSYYRRRNDNRGFYMTRRRMNNRKEVIEQRQMFERHGIVIGVHIDENSSSKVPFNAKVFPKTNVKETPTTPNTKPSDQATTSKKTDGVAHITRLLRTTSIVQEAKSQSPIESSSDEEQSDAEIEDVNLREIINDINYDEYNIDEEIEGDDEFLLQTESKPKAKGSKPKTKQEKKGYVKIDGVDVKIIYPEYETYNFWVGNRWVVATNYGLSLEFNAHINVERCGAMRAVKYIFKYIYKGGDCANLILTRNDGEGTLNYDEPQNRMDSRYVSSPEACWRLFEFALSGKSHFVYRLPVHLPDEQPIVFDPDQIDNDIAVFEETVEGQASKDTQLTAWFKLNLENKMTESIKYCDMAKFYTWDKSTREWNVRKIGHEFAISRIYPVSPGNELFYLRLLLLHVAGFTSFEDVRTTYDEDGITTQHPTFKQAAVARGLTLDDSEYDECMREASRSRMPWQLRQLFFNICQELQATNYRTMFDNHKEAMMDDYRLNHPITDANGKIVSNREQIELLWDNLLLRDLNKLFMQINKTNHDFGLEMPDDAILRPYYHNDNSREFSFSRYSQVENQKRGAEMVKKLNADQRNVYTKVMDRVSGKTQCNDNHIWTKGCGGTGKTFLLNALIATLKGCDKHVVTFAQTGIAASLLDGATTFNRAWKCSLEIRDNTTPNINRQEPYAKYLKSVALFIWDEAAQGSKYQANMIDRYLQDLMGNKHFFGGKPILLTGDWRQTLPILKGFKVTQIIESVLKKSNMWETITKLQLKQNMRVDINQWEFQRWLGLIGDGKIPKYVTKSNHNTDLIPIDDKVVIHRDRNKKHQQPMIQDLIDIIFGESISYEDAMATDEPNCIVTPFNVHKNFVNGKVLDRLKGEDENVPALVRLYTSFDSVKDENNKQKPHKTRKDRLVFSDRYLNLQQPGNLPPHQLFLKKGALVILLKNLNVSRGLCNGTRMIIVNMGERIIECKVVTGAAKGETIFVNRMFCESNQNMPITLVRRQFPLCLAYALSIDKSQGQTFNKIGIFLPQPVFSHGQLYVGLSRVRNFESCHVAIEHSYRHGYINPDKQNTIYTDNIVLRTLFSDDEQ